MILEDLKVVSADEMARIEKLSTSQGHSSAQYMDKAGQSIADLTAAFMTKRRLDKHVILLTGKGNNAGDAYTAGTYLLAKGFSVAAHPLYSPDLCSPLCREREAAFVKAGGKVLPPGTFQFGTKGIILDGIVGTGFQGKAEGILQTAILQANQSNLPILAIDIPSGVNGNTGDVGSVAIQATKTLFLELPKIGCFIGSGWDYTGELVKAEFGLPPRFIEEADTQCYLLKNQSLFLPPLKRSRHKYEAGYVIGIAGSKTMEGAAHLASLAALRSGAGIVRLFHMPDMPPHSFPPEILKEPIDQTRILEEAKRAASFFIGPGLGRSRDAHKLLQALQPPCPTVYDADALYFFSQDLTPPKNSLLTPHRGEMSRLLSGASPTLANCQAYAEEKQVTLILKGAPTFIFHPRTKPLLVPCGNPGMATAGSGDVLTGILASLLAQKCDPRSAAALGVLLHSLAGNAAIQVKTPYCCIASDLIAHLPEAFRRI